MVCQRSVPVNAAGHDLEVIGNWRNMYGPPPECKKNRLTRNSLRKCIRPLVEIGLRAHDDDPRVPVLIIAAVVKDLVSPQVFRHAV